MKIIQLSFVLLIALVLNLYLFGASSVFAAPSVSKVSSTLSGGNTITITGSGFGIKSKAAPLRYDDFEHGTIGQRIDSTWRTNVPYPIYSNTQQRYAGRQSALQRFETHYGNSLALDNRKVSGQIPPTKELYVTGWFWMETGGALSRNAKIINMGTAQENSWQTRIDVYPSTASGHLYAHTSSNCGVSSTYTHDWSAKPSNTLLPDKKWHRIETYLRIGTNGYRDVWVDGKKIAEISGSFTGDSCNIGYLLIGHYFAKDVGTPTPWANRYWDELYVDTTRARVEIGNASTWAASTHREIQPATSWTSGSISVTPNYGSFKSGEPAYLYVVDASGAVSNGTPITIGISGTSNSTPTDYTDTVNPQVSSACHHFDKNTSVQRGFGAAYDPYNPNTLLIKTFCNTSSVDIEVGENLKTRYIYKYAQIFKNNSWQRINLIPANTSNTRSGDWIIGQAKANYPLTSTELTQDNYVITYTCNLANNQWKCGCKDTLCSTPYWQLQRFGM